MEIRDKDNVLLAIVIKGDSINKGKNFLTPNEDDFQLAAFNLEAGDKIIRHYHPEQKRNITKTSEAIVVIEGEIDVTIYDKDLDIVNEVKLFKGDTVALISGGHEMKIKKDSKFVEVKQGPYDPNTDKVRF